MHRIVFRRAKCIGCNACVEAAPDRWRVSRKDGKCSLVKGIDKKDTSQVLIEDFEVEQNKKAAANCPVSIIEVIQV